VAEGRGIERKELCDKKGEKFCGGKLNGLKR